MKFDPERALRIVEELGAPRFAGPDGEVHEADYVAHQLSKMGLQVQRRDVTGSRIPQFAVASLNWLGFGVVMTAAVAIVSTFGYRWPTAVLGWPLLILASMWLVFGLGQGLRFGWNIPPRGTAPLVVARTQTEILPSCRVVFQTPVGRLSACSDRHPTWLSGKVAALLYVFLMFDAGSAGRYDSYFPGGAFYSRALRGGLLGLLWVFIVARLTWERRSRPSARTLELADRTGLAVLLEMARTWSPARLPRAEIVFAAAGGQMLDFAGARAMLRSIHNESSGVPTLLVLWFAPGIGTNLIIASRDLRDLAEAAAKSLWIPHRLASRWYRSSALWPSLRSHGETVSLLSASYQDGSHTTSVVDPASLGTTAQLATEIGLRWAKEQQAAAKS
jgi:hypothetical protein